MKLPLKVPFKLPFELSWYPVIAALILAGTIHVGAVLSLPYLAPDNGWTRLSALGETNRLVVLPTASPAHQSIPLMAPDVRYAFCRYDLNAGPVRLSTRILDDLWMIAFYTPRGDNFYAISGGDIQRNKVEIIISSQSEQASELDRESDEDRDHVVVVTVPNKLGLVLIRAPLSGASYDTRTESALRAASCSPFLQTTTRPAALSPSG